MSPNFTLHSRFGRVLSIIVIAAFAAGLVITAIQGRWLDALQVAPIFGLLSLLTWAMFWRPNVYVTAAGVSVRNVLRTIEVAWPEIRRIDTKYALTLETPHGTVTAWAAPAPGRHSVFSAVRQDGANLPESSYLAGTVRPGDLITSDSGQAAHVIRTHWEQLRDDGHLDVATSEFTKLRVTWHWRTIAALVALTALVFVSTLG
ncbi:PH domain-containing protein [Salinibacterium sp. NK8237]|uniref:PH domain-containing protein n=1 Tax=Salinibacterium sp. NK8237 TaxID=2792038 RepID=UPI0018CDCD22|nr:PH domain-containing protein [Salinibacterium sp. NK8237]MBH0131093.1 PH domain-containing protein [Salinibacterium sp. NK8237]